MRSSSNETSRCVLIGALFGALLLVSSASPQDDATSMAIDRGINYLMPKFEERLNGLIAEFGTGAVRPTQENGVGRLALELYALVVAGVPVDNPTIARAFDFLSRMTFAHTYTVALYIFALDAAISQIEDDLFLFQPQRVRARLRDDPNVGKEYRPRLRAAVESFIRSQNRLGVWRYGPGAQDFDNSNVQFAVLALGVGAKRSVPIDPSVWTKIMDHFVKGQQKEGPEIKDRLTLKPPEERGMRRGEDVKIVKAPSSKSKQSAGSKKGADSKTAVRTAVKSEDPEVGTEDIQVFQRGWDYENKGGATWNMTCAGLSSLLLARENLRGTLSPEAKRALDKAIWDGYGWLMGHWDPNNNYYGMYSLEKVGDIGEVLRFGPHDWYEEMRQFLVSRQKPDGSWPQGAWAESDPVATAYALLILNRATSLLAMDRSNKIVLSGRKSTAEGQEARKWVYVRELDTSLHAPTLLRALRLRPSPRLLKLAERVVESYDPEYRGEIILDLLSVRDAFEKAQPKAVKAVDDLLALVTGVRYENPELYMKWAERWRRVREIGESMNAARKDDLLAYYRSTQKSLPLKKLVVWAIGRCKVREAIPLFLEDLDNPDASVRRMAYDAFRGFFIDPPPPFDENAGDETRKRQIADIRAWYAKQS